MKSLLMAIDGTPNSDRTLAVGETLLAAWPLARLTVLYVTPEPVIEEYACIPQSVLEKETKFTADVKKRAMKIMEIVSDRVEFVHVSGQVVPLICSQAEQQHADLIVVGSHERDANSQAALGGVCAGVVRYAKTSVLVVV
ncbi:MAG: universal stress protein [Bacilli bacterium]